MPPLNHILDFKSLIFRWNLEYIAFADMLDFKNIVKNLNEKLNKLGGILNSKFSVVFIIIKIGNLLLIRKLLLTGLNLLVNIFIYDSDDFEKRFFKYAKEPNNDIVLQKYNNTGNFFVNNRGLFIYSADILSRAIIRRSNNE
ncbi:hypothetical protein Tthe_2189 [Thermoanaerobacterium thermosaccharolyticum DSM 571]|uniref:Uncharacterized protein n=2 Tax=Thermoanaerobacterium thermosaccharolyticum TaxID=1517 RepID=D9TRY7_THETC|nr:hypothetical protein Tthe_2189 [Thermoanaerobacterium thermosaccharolyticum DSM 571]